ncbi:hypothetical protein MKW98_023898 [Papaver atlanticum]|uniref:Uncharacterized protein n=1 Tax=Papaver atlanticum TaxID=357466 RepID=A0AAD4XP56_9MAGN|nr:hypothetical protein MKW98_023898 [Papaver atlanticum]
MSTRRVTRASKDLKIHDSHTHCPAAPASMCPPKSKQQIEEEEEDDDDFSDSSLSDYHPEEYPIAATESEDSDSESEDIEEGVDRTTQSVFYPNKRMKGETNTRSEPSTFRPKSNLLYEYVPWSSKSSSCENDTLEKGSWIDSWSWEPGKDRKGYHYLNIYVVASASVQQNGKSYFYHVLDGVKDGLALALQHKKYDLKLLCNSRTLAGCLGHIFQQADDGLSKTRRTRIRQAPYQCGACNTCLSWAIPLDGKRLEILFPLLKEIIDTRTKIMSKSRYFFVNYESTTAGKPEIKEIIRPTNFVEELKTILFEDACVGSRRYSQQR